MTSTFTKISIAIAVAAMLFGAFSVITGTSIISNEAQAWGSSCGGCGEGPGDGPGDPVGPGDGPGPIPSCVMEANPVSIVRGTSATLTWSTTNAISATLQSFGPVNTGTNIDYTVSPTVTTSYFLFVFSSGGETSSCAATVLVTEPPVTPVPTCTASVSKNPIERGETAQITWSTTNATTVTLQRPTSIQTLTASGTTDIAPTTSYTFKVIATNSAGTVECPVSVTVTNPPVEPAPTCVLNAVDPAIQRGTSTNLNWSTTNATTVTLQRPDRIQTLNASGTTSVSPSTTYTFVLTATGPGGTVTCDETVTVTDVPPPPAPTCALNAYPSTITAGESTRIEWSSTNAVYRAVAGLTNVAATGTISRSPLQTRVYTMLVRNSAGVERTCDVTVTVNPVVSAPIKCETDVTFTASDASIDEGDSTTLTWNTSRITGVSFNQGINDTRLTGELTVSPRSNTTYILTATDGTDTISCPLEIEVDEDNGGGGGSPTPRCTLTISDRSITAGERVTLEWDTTNATDVTIEDNHGKTLVTTENRSSSNKRDLYDGEITLRPDRDTTYTLVAERGSRDRKCTVDVDVSGSVIVTETRDQQPVVTGITLTQLPYTGFEAGPFLTTLFYGILLLWALYLAYVLVVRRQGVPAMVPSATAASIVEDKVNATGVFTTTSAPTPRFVAAAPAVADAAPVAPAVIGYASTVARDEVYDAIATKVENAAHAERILLSGDAMRHFIDVTTTDNRESILAAALEKAKASYPREDGWVVMNLDRMQQVCIACAATLPVVPAFTPTTIAPAGQSSLAEAIVIGNIVAAYQMIGHRPMVALAEAAAELDALYRAKQGVAVPLSAMMQQAGANLTADQVKKAIDALTGALDGTYGTEGEAVKMAILKAIKALS